MKKIYLILSLFLFLTISLSAQCSLTSFSLTNNPNLCDGEIGGVSFEFEGTNFGLNGFTITVEGQSTNVFELGDEYIVYLISDCNNTYDFTITDNDDANCTMTTTSEPVCCPCELGFDLEVASTDCLTGNIFNVTLDFYPEEGSCLSYGWNLTVNGIPISYVYSGSGFIYNASSLSSEDSLLVFTFCSIGSTGECFSDTIINPCYESSVCVIDDVSAVVGECEDALFDVTIDFSYEYEGDNGFSIVGNGVDYGDFDYSQLPIVIEGLSADCELEYEFIVIDNTNDECSAFTELGIVCCSGECAISDVVLTSTDCTGDENGIFYLTIDFDVVYPTNDYFEVWANGYLGTFALADLPVTVEVSNNQNETIEFVACLDNNTNCCIYEMIDNPCMGYGSCSMYPFDFGANPVCEDGQIVAQWLINGYNVSQVGYDLYINDVFELFIPYESDSWYDFDITAPNTQIVAMTICDNDNEECCSSWEIENPCYESSVCVIDDVSAVVGECEDALFDVTIDFSYEYEGDNGFSIVGNGVDYGDFDYSQLPIVIEGLSADCELEYEFIVIDNTNDECTDFVGIGVVCCEEEDCVLSNLSLISSECDSISNYVLTIDFEYENPGNDYFDLWVDGEFVDYFQLSTLPVDLDIVNNSMEFSNVQLCINDNPNCCINGDINNPCYPLIFGIDDFSKLNIDIKVIANNTIIIKKDISEIINIEVYNIQGQSMYHTKMMSNENSGSINTLGWNTGIYFIKAFNGRGYITKKIFL